MLLKTSFLSKAGFFGSLLSRCRPSIVLAASFNTPSAGLKTLEEQVGLPPRPKKPLTPYFRFMVDMRSKMLAEEPTIKTIEAVRSISRKWKTVDPNLKQRLEEEYKKEKQIYVEKRARYDAKITDYHRSEMKKLKDEKAKVKERKQLRQRVKDLGRPKRPASAFLRYINQQRIINPYLPPVTYREWYQTCIDRWGKLSPNEKEEFFKEAAVEFEKYRKDITMWEEKMVRLGNVDVVRVKAQVDPEHKLYK